MFSLFRSTAAVRCIRCIRCMVASSLAAASLSACASRVVLQADPKGG